MFGFLKKKTTTTLETKAEKPEEATHTPSKNNSSEIVESNQSDTPLAKSETYIEKKLGIGGSGGGLNSAFNSNPYLDARREWAERYGSYIAHARNWRLFSLGMLAIALVESVGLVVLGSQNKLVPYIIEVDKLGAPMAINYAEQIRPVDERVLRFLLARFFVDSRNVVADGIVQRQMIDRVYSMLPTGSQASQYVSEFLKNPNPFVRAQTTSITIDLKSMMKLSEKTWQLEWVETSRNLSGGIIGTSTWRANATLTVSPPDSEELVRENPIGLYITHISWAEVKGSFN